MCSHTAATLVLGDGNISHSLSTRKIQVANVENVSNELMSFSYSHLTLDFFYSPPLPLRPLTMQFLQLNEWFRNFHLFYVWGFFFELVDSMKIESQMSCTWLHFLLPCVGKNNYSRWYFNRVSLLLSLRHVHGIRCNCHWVLLISILSIQIILIIFFHFSYYRFR